ncbi:uncharacterized protein LOC126880510 [Diabrotica virgifera virgifera]|uniref:HAT C-terminal dimerisation domain-containing protein n=1 Tax=Diabrotica virgifera virgifera TaxID=50390 RepID=A0ABM5JR00_DIAVI|nr:uncharacterized protein LOC126880510 [Diabrotica virgifera virgifera]
MLLEPIANTITSVEGDTPTISKCLHLFKKMVNTSLENVTKSPLLSKEEADTRAIFENRKKFAIYSVHFVANLLDPKYRGCELSSDEMTDATEVIYKVAQKMPDVDEAAVLADVVNFIAKEGLFKKAFLWNEDTIAAISPIAWWSGLCSNTALSKLAIRFLELPATSAACERSFSSYSGIHTNKRNGLTNTRASKIGYVAHNLKLMAELQPSESSSSESIAGPSFTVNPALESEPEPMIISNSDQSESVFESDEEEASESEENADSDGTDQCSFKGFG